MSKKRSDALQALVLEVVDCSDAIVGARESEEEARQEFTAARQVLDQRTRKTADAEARYAATIAALKLIQERDEVSEETIAALRARAEGR